jgi:hypothetical protein
MNFTTRTDMQTAYREKFAKRANESVSFWLARINYAIADIHATFPLHSHDSEYAQRLYLELDEARVAFQKANRERVAA